MIKEGQKIQRHDKTNLKKYRRQKEKTKDRQQQTRAKTEKQHRLR